MGTALLVQAEQLQCFEVLMQLCDQLGCLEGAARFAQAAAHQAQLLRSGHQGSEQGELLAREGRIWDNLFEYALQAGSYQVGNGAHAVLIRLHAQVSTLNAYHVQWAILQDPIVSGVSTLIAVNMLAT